MPPAKVNPFAHNLSLGYEPSLQKLYLKIREEKLKKHLYDKGIYTFDIPPYLLTLNGGFINKGKMHLIIGSPNQSTSRSRERSSQDLRSSMCSLRRGSSLC